MSFSQKILQFDFSMGTGVFNGGGNSHSAVGLRSSVRIETVSGMTMGKMDAAIYGLPLSVMNQLSTVGTQMTQVRNNTISVSAGDSDSGVTQIYTGTINYAYVDAQNMPEVAFRVQALAGLKEAAMPTDPVSYQGSTDVAQIAQKIAGAAGLKFENNGVSIKLANPYLWGSPRSQILSLVEHAGIEHVIENGTLAIWPAGQSRSGTALISPETGLVGTPMFDQSGVIVKTLYNPSIKFGQQIEIQSIITPACGTWNIYYLEYILDAVTPHGQWFQTIKALRGGSPSDTTPSTAG